MIYGTNFFYGRITGIRSGQISNLAQLPTDINYTAKEKNNLYYNPIYRDSIEYLRKKIMDWQEKVDDKLVL